MPTFTQNFNLEKPTPDDPATEDTWGATLNDNLDLIDAAITRAGLNRVPLYRWSDDNNLSRWEEYTLVVSDEAGALRFTNSAAAPNDGAIYLPVPAGRMVIITATTSAASGMAEGSTDMHFGNAANTYGGYGFSYGVNIGHPLTLTDDLLVIYMETQEGAAGDWVEFSDITVEMVESGQRITASATAPATPNPGDVWIDLS